MWQVEKRTLQSHCWCLFIRWTQGDNRAEERRKLKKQNHLRIIQMKTETSKKRNGAIKWSYSKIQVRPAVLLKTNLKFTWGCDFPATTAVEMVAVDQAATRRRWQGLSAANHSHLRQFNVRLRKEAIGRQQSIVDWEGTMSRLEETKVP